MSTLIQAHGLHQQPVSVTRQMASAFPRLKAMAEEKGLKLHHLGAGYPHPEVSDPTTYIAHKDAYFRHLALQSNPDDPGAARDAYLTAAKFYGIARFPAKSLPGQLEAYRLRLKYYQLAGYWFG